MRVTVSSGTNVTAIPAAAHDSTICGSNTSPPWLPTAALAGHSSFVYDQFVTFSRSGLVQLVRCEHARPGLPRDPPDSFELYRHLGGEVGPLSNYSTDCLRGESAPRGEVTFCDASTIQHFVQVKNQAVVLISRIYDLRERGSLFFAEPSLVKLIVQDKVTGAIHLRPCSIMGVSERFGTNVPIALIPPPSYR